MDIYKIHPADLVNRYLVYNTIRNDYTPEQVAEFNVNFILDMVDENDQTVIEMDWEYCFFVAEQAELQFLIERLHKKYSKKKDTLIVDGKEQPIPQIISDLQAKDELTKPKMNIVAKDGQDLN